MLAAVVGLQDQELRVAGGDPAAEKHDERATYGDDLMTNTETLNKRVQTMKYTVDQIGNGSKGLLDEVAGGIIINGSDALTRKINVAAKLKEEDGLLEP